MHQIWAHGIQEVSKRPSQNNIEHGSQQSELKSSSVTNSQLDVIEKKNKGQGILPPTCEKFKLKYERPPSGSDRSSVCETAKHVENLQANTTPFTDRNLLQNQFDVSAGTQTTAKKIAIQEQASDLITPEVRSETNTEVMPF